MSGEYGPQDEIAGLRRVSEAEHYADDLPADVQALIPAFHAINPPCSQSDFMTIVLHALNDPAALVALLSRAQAAGTVIEWPS